jgi:hypothetical protein
MELHRWLLACKNNSCQHENLKNRLMLAQRANETSAVAAPHYVIRKVDVQHSVRKRVLVLPRESLIHNRIENRPMTNLVEI